MLALWQTCSVCAGSFELQCNFQMQQQEIRDRSGQRRTAFGFYCSDRCRDAASRASTWEICAACHAAFRDSSSSFAGAARWAHCPTGIEGAQGLEHGPVCSEACDDQLQAEALEARLGRLPLPADRPGRPDPARVIAVFNHEGRVGKTTTAVVLAAGLARRGRRVLLIDADPQGGVAAALGLSAARSLYHVIVLGTAADRAAQRVAPGLDVITSNEALAAAELFLAGRPRRSTLLGERLRNVHAAYDHVIVDCGTALSLVNQNVLTFADCVLCPAACDSPSLSGVRQVLRTLRRVHNVLGHSVRLWGVLPTFYEPRRASSREALSALRRHFAGRCCEPVRWARALGPARGVRTDYVKLVDRVMDGGAVETHALVGGRPARKFRYVPQELSA